MASTTTRRRATTRPRRSFRGSVRSRSSASTCVPEAIRVRRAEASDAAALARLAESTFRETFAEHNSADDMARHCAAHFGAAIQEAEILDRGVATCLAERGGELAGFAQLRLHQPKEGV